MEKLKISLYFESPISISYNRLGIPTPLQSDTFFGEFCWHYRFLYGEEKLRNILGEKPAVVFSNGLPEGYLPMPTYPFGKNLNDIRLESGWCEAQKFYTSMKKFKKIAYVKKEVLENCILGYPLKVVMEKLFEDFRKLQEEEDKREEGRKKKFNCIKEEKKNEEGKNKDKDIKIFLESGDVFKNRGMTRVSIDRRSGKALEGFLFQERSYYTKYPISVYLLYDPERVERKEIEETFKFMGISGFGAKKSVGKGKFKCEFKEWDLKETISGKGKLAFVSLSTGYPKAEEIEDLYAEFFTKFPKHGREFGEAAIFKNPVVVARQGSVFIPKEKKEYYGTFETLSKNPEHLHSLHIIPYFVEL